MAEILHPYNVHHFNNMPYLAEAEEAFTTNNGPDFVEHVFRPLLMKHKLETKLGLGLLHRHFKLDEPERLVEINNVSTPWAEGAFVKANTAPSGWLIRGGKLMPYEFHFSPADDHATFDIKSAQPFIDEFLLAAKTAGVEDIVALRLFPGQGYRGCLEVTQDRANINLVPGQVCASVCQNYTHLWLIVAVF